MTLKKQLATINSVNNRIKILAKHMTNILPSIINHDQSAYTKGRYIGENLRTITDITEYCKRKNTISYHPPN